MNETARLTFTPFSTGLIATLATAVSIATMVGNVVVLIAFFVERSLRVPSNYFIASLAVTDVLIGLFSMNLFITYQLLGYWPLGTIICDLWLTLDFSACLTSQYTVFLITMDRFCSVKLPAKYRNWRTYNKVRVLICVSWILPASLFTPVILGWQKLTGESPRSENKCDVSFTYYPIFNTTLTVGYFWITLVVMCSLYVGIYNVARRLEKKSNEAGKRVATLFPVADTERTQTDNKRYSNHEADDDDDDDNDESDEENHRDCGTKCHLVQSDLITITALDSGFRDSHSPADVSDELPKENLPNHWKKTKIRLEDGKESELKVKALSKLTDITEENHLLCLPLDTWEGRVTSPKETQLRRESHREKKLPTPSDVDYDSAVSDATCSQDYTSTGVDPFVDYLNSQTNRNNNLAKHVNPINPTSEPTTPKNVRNRKSRIETNDWDYSTSEFSGSLPSVNIYVPSPIVPISSPNQKLENKPSSESQTAVQNDSPIWIRHERMSDQSVDPYTCIICLQMLQNQSGNNNNNNNLVQEQSFKPMESCYCFSSKSPSMEQWLSKLYTNDKIEFSDYTTSSTNESFMMEGPITDCSCPNLFRKFRKPDKNIRRIQIVKQIENGKSKPNKLCDCLSKCTSSTVPEDECHQNAECDCSKLTSPKPAEKSPFKMQSPQQTTDRTSKSNQTEVQKCKLTHSNFNKRGGSILNHSRRKNGPSEDPGHTYKGRHISLPMLKPLSNGDSYSRRHARKALRTISFILGAFMMCWTPYHIIVMIKGFCDDIRDHSSCVNSYLYNLSYWLCYMNSPINPFCYALSNASFRRTFFRILRGDFRKR